MEIIRREKTTKPGQKQNFPRVPQQYPTLIIPPRAKRRMVPIVGWSSQVARQAHNPALRDRRFKSKTVMDPLSTPKNTCKDYQVYLLRNAGGKTYIALSENVRHRLEDHNAGKSRFTAKHKPWNLIWISGIMPLGEARKLENPLKRQKGGKGLQPLLDQHGDWVDLPD